MKVCPNCKIAYDDKFSFCKKCGQKLNDYIEQSPENFQTFASGNVLDNNINKKTDSKKGLIIASVCIVLALIGFFAFGGNFSNETNSRANNSQNMIASTNSNVNKSRVKEEVDKEARAAAEINAQKNQSTSQNNNKSLPFEPKVKGYINGTDVFMRAGPGKQYNTVGMFRKGESVEILSEQGEWIKVLTDNNNTVWVFKQYCGRFITDMPSSEMSLGGIVPLKITLRDVKNIYGEPADKKVFEGEGAHVVTYSYGSLFKVFGRTGVSKDKNMMIIENNIPVIGYSIYANNLATQSGFKVGMPYQNVIDLYGVGKQYSHEDGTVSYYYSNHQLQQISFNIDDKGIITGISVTQEW